MVWLYMFWKILLIDFFKIQGCPAPSLITLIGSNVQSTKVEGAEPPSPPSITHIH